MGISDLNGRFTRWLYRGGRPSRMAKIMNVPSRIVGTRGWWSSRLVALEVTGRRSGRSVSFPLVPAMMPGAQPGGDQYLVAMLGEGANWVANIRASGGRARLHHGPVDEVRLVEVPAAERAPIIKRYLELAPGARPHIPVDQHAPLSDFAAVAADIPVFRIEPA